MGQIILLCVIDFWQKVTVVPPRKRGDLRHRSRNIHLLPQYMYSPALRFVLHICDPRVAKPSVLIYMRTRFVGIAQRNLKKELFSRFFILKRMH